ncbi:MAG: TerD family protein [Lachnospiraceae bacterium]|nr:TerD family protein [Lachnospiraceae bacterium]
MPQNNSMQQNNAAYQSNPMPQNNSMQQNNAVYQSNVTPQSTVTPAAASAPQVCVIPELQRPVQKGQRVDLFAGNMTNKISACLGWNVSNLACDVDVSAFLLGANGKVIGDDWFVFYGQPESPDGSTVFSANSNTDRQSISIDLNQLHTEVTKIVFVLTINEALEKHLNFSMLKDAYLRILDQNTGNELVSFMMDEYYDNVNSMMIGELYRHNGTWKFNAIGNGVTKDLEGLCELYGVQVI